jgi:hypothetical protein
MYIIHELQNLNSVRNGTEHNGSLRAAKTAATRGQVYQGTVLKITDEEGRTVSVKTPQGWQDYDQFGETI